MTSLGVSNSGVQAISEASVEGPSQVKRTYNGLTRFFVVLALVVTLLVIIFANQLSIILTEKSELKLYIMIASIAILIRVVSNVQNSLIIGMQKIAMLARAKIYQGFAVALVSIALVYFLRLKSIPLLVLTIALVSFVISTTQVRKVLRDLPSLKESIDLHKLKPILVLGAVTIWASFLEHGVRLITKSSIIHRFGDDYLGYYQVAIGFTLQYVGFITSSITNDYYPRLTQKVTQKSDDVNEFVNNQIGISMNLIMPVLLVMLTFSKQFIVLLFSKEFLPSNELVSLGVIGTLFMVVSWPIAYVFLAHRATKTYFITEFTGNSSHLALILLAIFLGSFYYLGIAYVIHYVIYLVVISIIYIKKYKGHFERKNVLLFLANLVVAFGIMLIQFFAKNEIIAKASGLVLVLVYLYVARKEYQFMLKAILKKRGK